MLFYCRKLYAFLISATCTLTAVSCGNFKPATGTGSNSNHWEWQWSAKAVPQQQCQCILKPGTNECFQYDSKYQAASLEEAISFFVDPTLDDSEIPPPSDEACPECKINCEKQLREKLRAIGLLEGPLSAAELKSISTKECSKYRFTHQDSRNYEYRKEKSDKGRRRMAGMHPRSANWGRRIRQATPTQGLGTGFQLSCVRKGVTSDPDGLLELCSKCWSWRRLPTGYFPQFVNELICDEQDTVCLAGYGKCTSGHRVVDVIKTDQGKKKLVTIPTRAFCDCKIKVGSAIENLVSGTKNV